MDLSIKFNFTLCSSCHSSFQRKKSYITNNISNSSNNLKNNKSNENSIDLNKFDDKSECKVGERSKAKQIISFNLIIKSSTGPLLPSK